MSVCAPPAAVAFRLPPLLLPPPSAPRAVVGSPLLLLPPPTRTVHALMYLYYALQAMGVKVNWGMLVTALQIAQMMVGCATCVAVMHSIACNPAIATTRAASQLASFFTPRTWRCLSTSQWAGGAAAPAPSRRVRRAPRANSKWVGHCSVVMLNMLNVEARVD